MSIRSLRNRKNEHKAKKSKNKPDSSTVNEIAHFTSSYTPRHIKAFCASKKGEGVKKKKKNWIYQRSLLLPVSASLLPSTNSLCMI